MYLSKRVTSNPTRKQWLDVRFSPWRTYYADDGGYVIALQPRYVHYCKGLIDRRSTALSAQ